MQNHATKLTFFLLTFFLSNAVFAQNCTLSLRGYVTDEDDDRPLEFVSVFMEENSRGAVSDSTGFFQIDDICAGDYHVAFSHIGCSPRRIFTEIDADTLLRVEMDHSAKILEGVTVTDKQSVTGTQNAQVIGAQKITDAADENLTNILTNISGVSALKNGSGIAKPVVHGLYGNRITILNNGIAQSGQQWGNDHSPEIDAQVAEKIRVVKGVSALEYPGSKLGSVIIVEPAAIEDEPHLHGRAGYIFASNGRTHAANVQVGQTTDFAAWKVTGTLKRGGDKRTADYFLNNTGLREANVALQMEKKFSERLHTDFYASTFNTELGVLRGSHIGNLTDLENAFEREEPFFTEEEFSYAVDAPKQRVGHHLLKLKTKYFVDAYQSFDFTAAAQLNDRKEFDVRRSGRSEIPALSLRQFTYFAEGKYRRVFQNKNTLTTGLQTNITDNTNNPETGILPLIPDYLAYETGAFILFDKITNRSRFSFGLRYDNVLQNAVTITTTTPREIVRFNEVYHNYSGAAGWTYNFSEAVKATANVGYATRNPAINELYSAGLHQGVSGIEEGNPNLDSEKSLKSTLALTANTADKFTFDLLLYLQNINDYIYLLPENEFRLTIRGAFPVFTYAQTDARIYGADFSANYQVMPALQAKATYSHIRGEDLTNQETLINIPADNWLLQLDYSFAQTLRMGKIAFENLTLGTEARFVSRKKGITPEQDFTAVPDAYELFGAKIAADVRIGKNKFRLTLRGDNLLDTAYRDYLNRLRYFADDTGRNVSVGLSYKF